VPDGVSGLLSATGKGNHSPAFEGDVKVSSGGATLTAKVIAVDGTVYANTGITPGYLTIDPASLKAPDPAGLLDPDSGLTSILASTEDLKTGDQSRDGRDVLTSVTGTLPGSVVADIIPSASRQGTFTVTYRLTDEDELRDAKMTGPFYGEGSKVTYTVKLATSDEPVTITAPAATGGR
jgi:lipoprotein LprG